MMSRVVSTVAAALILCAGLFFMTPDAVAMENLRSPTSAETFEPPVKVGTFDFTLGVGGLLYNVIEPGLDLALIPVGDKMVVSFGGLVNAGACIIGCSVLNFFIDPWSISAWHASLMGRVLLHINAIAELANLPGLDAYFGAVAGPNYYRVAISNNAPAATGVTAQGISLLIGPTAGARYTLSGQDGFFLWTEARFLAEIGSEELVVTDERGVVTSYNGLIRRGGRQANVGIGFRF